MNEHILETALKNQRRAWDIIEDLNVAGVWHSVGAEARLVGSLKTGLLMKHRDIDFHVYSPSLEISETFAAAKKFAEHKSVCGMLFKNGADTEEACFEWHLTYEDRLGELWQIDMIHILKGSRYDGYFENVAERISAVLTDETRMAVLEIKNDIPDGEGVMGVEIYRAVLSFCIRYYRSFFEWRWSNPADNIFQWLP